MPLSQIKDVDERKTDAVTSGMKIVQDVAHDLFQLRSVQNLELFRIGKPAGFHKGADPHSRIRYYMESKMNVIDIIPCEFKIPLTKALEITEKNSENEKVIIDALMPAIDYGDAVEEYQKVCGAYGLDNNYGGIRLYITDETTSTDQFDVQYTNNMLESALNGLTDKGRQLRDIMRSVTGSYDREATKAGSSLGGTAGGILGGVIDSLTGSEDNTFRENLTQLGSSVGQAIALGQKFSLPKIWSDSNYTPNLNAVVKLVSPYGHPDAIKEFIIKPLMYLLIIASSRTRDGISYRAAPKLSINAYGVANFPLASISGITVRRGGADTSFNIYRQPLSVDVSLTFQTLVNGFAAFDSPGKDPSSVLWGESNKIVSDINNAQAGRRALFPTLGTYLESLRPIAINKIVTKHNIKGLPRTPGLEALAKQDSTTDYQKLPSSELKERTQGNETTISATTQSNVNQRANETATGQTSDLAKGDNNSLIRASKHNTVNINSG